jgi:hypothetical protein
MGQQIDVSRTALLRHASITTTMAHYVGSMAKEAAKQLWATDSASWQ